MIDLGQQLDDRMLSELPDRRARLAKARKELEERMQAEQNNWWTSPVPYVKAVQEANLDRYTPGTFAGSVQSGVNQAKDYLAGMFTGETALNAREAKLKDDTNYLYASPVEQKAIQKKRLEDLSAQALDAVGFGTIAGRMAKGADLDKLKLAEELKALGTDTDEIYRQTKWWLDHPDKKPRFEIDDSKMKTLPIDMSKNHPLANTMQHDELLDNYSYLNNIWATENKGTGSYYAPAMKQIKIGDIESTNKFSKSPLAHENQHVVQGIEGFTKGGSPGRVQEDYYDHLTGKYDDGDYQKYDIKFRDVSEQLNPLWKIDSVNHFLNIKQPRQLFNTSDYYAMSDRLREQLGPPPKRNQLAWAQKAGELIAMEKTQKLGNYEKGLMKDSSPEEIKRQIRNLEAKRNRIPDDKVRESAEIRSEIKRTNPSVQLPYKEQHALYERLGGESESRLTQDRLDMTMAERLADPFYKHYDVPFDDMILKSDSGTSMSTRQPTEFEQAHAVAQKNAALPVSEGALGLPADNTAMDRAKAMGYNPDERIYHGTNKDFPAFDPMVRGEFSDIDTDGSVFTTYQPDVAGNYADQGTNVNIKGKLIGEGANIMPLMARGERKLIDAEGDYFDPDDMRNYIDDAKSEGYDRAAIYNIKDDTWYNPLGQTQEHEAVFDPKNIRSRFAAFDPMKKDSKDILAGLATLGVGLPAIMQLMEQKRNEL